jgi:hypothetical protein
MRLPSIDLSIIFLSNPFQRWRLLRTSSHTTVARTLNTGTPKPYHWSFFVQKELKGTMNLGIAHQLRGMPGAFY